MTNLDALSWLGVVADRALDSIGRATEPWDRRELPDTRSPELRAAVDAATQALVALRDRARTELHHIPQEGDR